MRKAIKVRIYPDARQQGILRRHIGHSRFVFNAGLRRCIWEYHAALESGKKPPKLSHFTLTTWLTEFKRNPDVAFLNEVPYDVLSLSLERVARAYKNFFGRRKDGVGFPRPKGKHSPRRARYKGSAVKVRDGRYVSLPPREVGWIRMRGWRPELCGRIKTTTVEWAASDRWYLSVMLDDGVEEPEAPLLPPAPRVVGVHFGLVDYITVHDGSSMEQVPHTRLLSRAEANLKTKQRKLSRKAEHAKRGPVSDRGYSKRRERARIQLARAHERVRNGRQDRAYKLAHWLAGEADVVVLETWNIQEMMSRDREEKRFGREIADAAWHQVMSRIEVKVRENGGRVVKLARGQASSQVCSACGVRSAGPVPLSAVRWTCGGCGVEHDRNENAARNVYWWGLAELDLAARACGRRRQECLRP